MRLREFAGNKIDRLLTLNGDEDDWVDYSHVLMDYRYRGVLVQHIYVVWRIFKPVSALERATFNGECQVGPYRKYYRTFNNSELNEAVFMAESWSKLGRSMHSRVYQETKDDVRAATAAKLGNPEHPKA